MVPIEEKADDMNGEKPGDDEKSDALRTLPVEEQEENIKDMTGTVIMPMA